MRPICDKQTIWFLYFTFDNELFKQKQLKIISKTFQLIIFLNVLLSLFNMNLPVGLSFLEKKKKKKQFLLYLSNGWANSGQYTRKLQTVK